MDLYGANPTSKRRPSPVRRRRARDKPQPQCRRPRGEVGAESGCSTHLILRYGGSALTEETYQKLRNESDGSVGKWGIPQNSKTIFGVSYGKLVSDKHRKTQMKLSMPQRGWPSMHAPGDQSKTQPILSIRSGNGKSPIYGWWSY